MTHTHGSGPFGREDGHSLSPMAQRTNRVVLVLALTVGYMLAEVAVGVTSHSLALLADAGHTLTDAIGLLMVLVAIWFVKRPATPSTTYGAYRSEILATLANCLLLFAIAAYILFEAWHRLQRPSEVHSLPMLAVAVVALVANLIGVLLLRSGAGESMGLRSAFLDVVADALGALGVVVAAIVIGLTHWWRIDPLVSIAIAAVILPRAWGLLTSTLNVLLEATPRGIDVRQIEAAMDAVPGVTGVHELHVWTITSGFVAMSAHALASDRPSSEVLHDLQTLLRTRFGIEHATLQVESDDHAEDGVCCSIDPRCFVVGHLGALSEVEPRDSRRAE